MKIPLEQLQDNKLSANVMSNEFREKLKANIKRQDNSMPIMSTFLCY